MDQAKGALRPARPPHTGRAMTSEDVEHGERVAGISNAIVGIFSECYGRGPTKAKTYLFDNYVFRVLEDILTTVERTLVQQRPEDLVRAGPAHLPGGVGGSLQAGRVRGHGPRGHRVPQSGDLRSRAGLRDFRPGRRSPGLGLPGRIPPGPLRHVDRDGGRQRYIRGPGQPRGDDDEVQAGREAGRTVGPASTCAGAPRAARGSSGRPAPVGRRRRPRRRAPRARAPPPARGRRTSARARSAGRRIRGRAGGRRDPHAARRGTEVERLLARQQTVELPAHTPRTCSAEARLEGVPQRHRGPNAGVA